MTGDGEAQFFSVEATDQNGSPGKTKKMHFLSSLFGWLIYVS